MNATAESLDSFTVMKHNDKVCQFSSNLEYTKKGHHQMEIKDPTDLYLSIYMFTLLQYLLSSTTCNNQVTSHNAQMYFFSHKVFRMGMLVFYFFVEKYVDS